MSGGAAPLRVVEADPQSVMPWADGAVNRAVAIPINDLDLYMARKDILRPSYFNVSYRIKIDKRYPALMAECQTANVPCWQGFSILVLTVGAAIGQDFKGVLAQRGEPLQATDLCDFWLWPRAEAPAIQRGVALSLKANFLTTVDVNDPAVEEAYARVRARTAANVDGQTDGQSTLHNERSSKEPVKSVKCVESPPPRGIVNQEKPTSRQELADHGLYRALIADFQRELHQRRRERGLAVWPDPANKYDLPDLSKAVYTAVKENRLAELEQLLRYVADCPLNGAIIHVKLQEEGFIPQRRPW